MFSEKKKGVLSNHWWHIGMVSDAHYHYSHYHALTFTLLESLGFSRGCASVSVTFFNQY